MVIYNVYDGDKKLCTGTVKQLCMRYGFTKSHLSKVKNKGKIKGYIVERIINDENIQTK